MDNHPYDGIVKTTIFPYTLTPDRNSCGLLDNQAVSLYCFLGLRNLGWIHSWRNWKNTGCRLTVGDRDDESRDGADASGAEHTHPYYVLTHSPTLDTSTHRHDVLTHLHTIYSYAHVCTHYMLEPTRTMY